MRKLKKQKPKMLKKKLNQMKKKNAKNRHLNVRHNPRNQNKTLKKNQKKRLVRKSNRGNKENDSIPSSLINLKLNFVNYNFIIKLKNVAIKLLILEQLE
jgi:hypothetical protein